MADSNSTATEQMRMSFAEYKATVTRAFAQGWFLGAKLEDEDDTKELDRLNRDWDASEAKAVLNQFEQMYQRARRVGGHTNG